MERQKNGYELHHIDETLKVNDKERYYKWNIEDLIMLTSSEHHRLHATGKAYTKGYHHSEETKKKISDAMKGENNPFYGKHHTEETKEKLKGENNPMYGKQHTDESRKKMSEARKGTRFTEEHKRKIAEALKSHVGWHYWTNGVEIKCSVECPR